MKDMINFLQDSSSPPSPYTVLILFRLNCTSLCEVHPSSVQAPYAVAELSPGKEQPLPDHQPIFRAHKKFSVTPSTVMPQLFVPNALFPRRGGFIPTPNPPSSIRVMRCHIKGPLKRRVTFCHTQHNTFK